MKLKSTADGLFGEQVNPYGESEPTFDSTCKYDIFEKEMKECEIINWQNFEATKVKLPLTKQMPGNTVFEGVEVWQYQDRMGGEWEIATPNIMSHFDNYEAFAAYYYNQNDCATKQFYQPLEVKEQVREEAQACECERPSDKGECQYHDGSECVKFGVGTTIQTPKASNPELGVDLTNQEYDADETLSEAALKYAASNALDSKGMIAFCKGANWKATQQQGWVRLEGVIDVLQKWCLSQGAAFIAPELLEELKTLKQ